VLVSKKAAGRAQEWAANPDGPAWPVALAGNQILHGPLRLVCPQDPFATGLDRFQRDQKVRAFA